MARGAHPNGRALRLGSPHPTTPFRHALGPPRRPGPPRTCQSKQQAGARANPGRKNDWQRQSPPFFQAMTEIATKTVTDSEAAAEAATGTVTEVVTGIAAEAAAEAEVTEAAAEVPTEAGINTRKPPAIASNGLDAMPPKGSTKAEGVHGHAPDPHSYAETPTAKQAASHSSQSRNRNSACTYCWRRTQTESSHL